MPDRTPVNSAVSGTVQRIGFGFDAGNYIYILGDDGRTYKYLHLSQIPDLRIGQSVSAGQPIGLSGNSGRVYGKNGGYHLHFEISEGDTDLPPEAAAALLGIIVGEQ